VRKPSLYPLQTDIMDVLMNECGIFVDNLLCKTFDIRELCESNLNRDSPAIGWDYVFSSAQLLHLEPKMIDNARQNMMDWIENSGAKFFIKNKKRKLEDISSDNSL